MKVLFIGIGGSAPAWYRCGLPANTLHQDWIGTVGKPGKLAVISGNLEGEPNYLDYDVIIVQQIAGQEWLQQVKEWQAEGIKVIYEIDDFIFGIHKIKDHRFQKHYANKYVKKQFSPIISQCDGVICSTDYLKEQMQKKFDTQFYVCKVGIDTARYQVELPEREDIIIGWSGGTGHHQAVGAWLEEVSKVMTVFENVKFISLGTRYGDPLNQRHPGRGMSIPWTTIENYPYALTNFDIIIAPAHESKYHLSKSDLRWLEASAVGIASVVDGRIYNEAVDGETALVVDSPEDSGDALMELLDSDDLRAKIGKQAQEYVLENRDIKTAAKEWDACLAEIAKA